jgi:hypothetical protein
MHALQRAACNGSGDLPHLKYMLSSSSRSMRCWLLAATSLASTIVIARARCRHAATTQQDGLMQVLAG